ncbi:DNA-directed RNA polymerase subunit beta [Patescibacteria group bacterium]|nr:DNA-directed RNA polymerase subunit beta [Patescibacteria group bacterium]
MPKKETAKDKAGKKVVKKQSPAKVKAKVVEPKKKEVKKVVKEVVKKDVKKIAKEVVKKVAKEVVKVEKKADEKAPTKSTKDSKKEKENVKVRGKKRLSLREGTFSMDPYIEQTSAPVICTANRRYFSTQKDKDIAIPPLIEVQLKSYKWFLEEGLRDLLDEVSPIADFSGKKLELHFLEHVIGEPKYTPEEARRKNVSYEAPLKVHVQLINKMTGEIKEQDIFLGSIPLMTVRGTFIINGIERVVVSQIVRSPGVFFSKNAAAPGMHSAKIIPKRGAWLEIETDKKGIITVKIDRKRKIPITALLRVFGYEKDTELLALFKNEITDIEHDYILNTLEKDPSKTLDEAYQSIYRKIRPGDLATPENAKALIHSMFFDYRKYDMGPVARYKLNKRFKLNTPNEKKFHTFQVDDLIHILKRLIKLNDKECEPDDIDHLSNRRVRAVGELVQNKFRVGLLRTDRIAKDRMTVMDLETVTPTQLINSRPITASLREFFASSQLSQFMDQTNPLAELAHKRRLSAMGPGGLSRERASFDVRDVHASHYGRICPIATPEGPNIGLVVHLASYARVNDYGFIETPFTEVQHVAQNKFKDIVGRTITADIVDPKGKKVVAKAGTTLDEKTAKAIEKIDIKEIPVKPFVTKKTAYYDADEEKPLTIAEANTEINEETGEFIDDRVAVRRDGEPLSVDSNAVTHIDVSPKQIISITTSLIPFLEHDDNTRASMGSNMQRQAVSLVSPHAPIVGTGMEEMAAKSSGLVIAAEDDGTISYVDGNEIQVIYKNGRKAVYPLRVYERSNQGTAIHQRVIVEKGQKVKKGEALADGAATEGGELALGQNLLVAYMSWQGYNYEDAVIISDKLVREGVYDSVHIETFSFDVRDTKLGPEIVTRDIPNVGENKLKDLDEYGVIRIGATVHEGDILVGKITPKGETELTAEERLLRAIFGDKARDVKDTSLRLPGGEGGKVVNIQIFTRQNGDELQTGVNRQLKVSVAQTRKISVGDKIAGRHGNKGVISIIVPQEDMPFLPDGTPVDIVLNPLGVSSRMNIGQILETHIGWAASKLGFKVATPTLNGITTEKIKELLKKADLPEDGKIQLYDGRTGEPFSHKTTVGIAYILKLSHLIEDKMHARSVGPYSLVTQQPLGGKAQHGGQRFGEMEVWALEAYGASHTLQEMLTIKSDDVYGRAKAYESIVKGIPIRKPRTPESFNVLVKELQSLCLSVDLIDSHKDDEAIYEETYTTKDAKLEEAGILDEDVEDREPIAKEIVEKLNEEIIDTTEPGEDVEFTETAAAELAEIEAEKQEAEDFE